MSNKHQETLKEVTKKSFGEIWSTLTTEQSEYLKDYIDRKIKDAKQTVQEYEQQGLEKHFFQLESKQETPEEAAENYTKDGNKHFMEKTNVQLGFIEGAKWQQERMYSEEEVMDMFHNLSMHLPLHYEFLVKEQFKKKIR